MAIHPHLSAPEEPTSIARGGSAENQDHGPVVGLAVALGCSNVFRATSGPERFRFAIAGLPIYHVVTNTTSESLLFRLQQVEGHLDQTAWEEFVRLYTPLMFYWARKTGLSTTDASDLVQDVITQVFQKLPDFCYDASKSFRGWLRTVTLNRYREIKRLKSSGIQFTTDSILEQLAPVEVAESVWDIDYARLLVAQSMEHVKNDFAPATWQALRLVMSDGKTVDEAAAATSVSPWTIYSARSRLLKRLRGELEGLL